MARKHKEALIIYGSLAPGEKNHFVMQDIPGEWLNATIHACIEDNGWSTRTGYPRFIPESDNTKDHRVMIFVSDQLYRFWDRIDEFEGTEDYHRILWEYISVDGESKNGFIYARKYD